MPAPSAGDGRLPAGLPPAAAADACDGQSWHRERAAPGRTHCFRYLLALLHRPGTQRGSADDLRRRQPDPQLLLRRRSGDRAAGDDRFRRGGADQSGHPRRVQGQGAGRPGAGDHRLDVAGETDGLYALFEIHAPRGHAVPMLRHAWLEAYYMLSRRMTARQRDATDRSGRRRVHRAGARIVADRAAERRAHMRPRCRRL
jgi:hypothetical protein